MATHDYIISNASGAAVRADLNNALAAIVSNNSNASSPSTTYAYQWWADTTTGQLKLRNSSNNGWITIIELDGTILMGDGSAASPGLAFATDTNTGIFTNAADKIGFATGGVERLEIGSSEVVFNDGSNDVDFRVESNGETHMLFVDAGNDRIGIGTSSPDTVLHINPAADAYITIQPGNTDGNAGILFDNSAGTQEAFFLYDTDDNYLRFGTNDTEVLRIDNDGNLQFMRSASSSFPEQKLKWSNDSTTTNGFYISQDSSRNGKIFHEQGLDILFGTNNTERARLDSSGRLLVGTSASLFGSNNIQSGNTGGNNFAGIRYTTGVGGAQLVLGHSQSGTIGSNVLLSDDDYIGSVEFRGADGTNYLVGAGIDAFVDGTPGTNDMPGRLVFSTTADGASSPTERMRIDSTGKTILLGTSTNGVLVAETTQGAASNKNIIVGGHSASSIDGGTGCFVVLSNGNVVNTNNSYGALSDVKLKENIVNASSQWDDLKAIQVRNYNLKESTGQQTHTQLGVVAQEVELVSPGLVSESPDLDADGNDLGTVTKSVNYSVLYMKAVKALQEAISKIETLETKVAALEAG